MERQGDREDPLGLREAWIKARTAVKRYAEGRITSKKNRHCGTENQGLTSEEGLVRIKEKIGRMRLDLGNRFLEGNHGAAAKGSDVRILTDPPDKDRGWDPFSDSNSRPGNERDQDVPIPRRKYHVLRMPPGV